jgi:putative endonuclease
VFSRERQMRDEYIYYVYMMQSASRRALYIGMTNSLRKRVWEHKNHIVKASPMNTIAPDLFIGKVMTMSNAINREKQLKRWRREKKEWLIARKNPRCKI